MPHDYNLRWSEEKEEPDDDIGALTDWAADFRSPDGLIRPRDLMRHGPRPRPRSAEDARLQLQGLVDAGMGRWTGDGPGRGVEFGDVSTEVVACGPVRALPMASSPAPIADEGSPWAHESP